MCKKNLWQLQVNVEPVLESWMPVLGVRSTIFSYFWIPYALHAFIASLALSPLPPWSVELSLALA